MLEQRAISHQTNWWMSKTSKPAGLCSGKNIGNNSALEGRRMTNKSVVQKSYSQELGNYRSLNFVCTW